MKKLERLIEQFDEAAKCWGWEQDQGYEPERIKNSKERYDSLKLEIQIAFLELAVKRSTRKRTNRLLLNYLLKQANKTFEPNNF